MSAIIFDGRELARQREELLSKTIQQKRIQPRLGTLVFSEDEAGLQYTQLKKRAAVRVGIEFSVEEVSFKESLNLIKNRLSKLCERDDFTGVMVQKPSKITWNEHFPNQSDRLDSWWGMLIQSLDPAKDVDCLTATNLHNVYEKQWKILPATVKGIITVLHRAYQEHKIFSNEYTGFDLSGVTAIVVGRSDIVGKPLSAVLSQYGALVENYGSDLPFERLKAADLIVTATGRENLIHGDMIKEGAVLIDAGYPKAEFEFESCSRKARFLTPVPGGIGPLTVVSLLENVVV